jgi:predicted lipid-binding transport protein (Tim44 family)
MFGPKMHVMEAPLAGAAIGGLIGGGGTIAGLATIGGLSGMAIGALLTKPLLSAFSPKMPKAAQSQQQQAAAETPELPPATKMPAMPNTPIATPEITAGDASAPTTEELARGELERKRRGRLSTILTSPRSRLDQGVDEGFERLGG